MRSTQKNMSVAIAFVVALGLTTACSKSSSNSSPSSPSPSPSPSVSTGAPRINSLSPNTPIASGSVQKMTVTGLNFRNGMSVLFDAPNGVWTWYQGAAITLNSDTSFTVAAMIDKAGLWDITVRNADGTESNEVQFTVAAPNT